MEQAMRHMRSQFCTLTGAKWRFEKHIKSLLNCSTVYNLLKREGGYSKKTAKSLVKTLPELNNYFSQSLFKEDDLKKIERLENFIKELLILPAVVRNSESVNKFFNAFMEKPVKCERTEKEEELKKNC
ncbi:unnamed protein product [Porites evermanni]|uniref:Uncharacterized protein n=1 Tax=Porites evermanni TaxID=104178 RepID=A0ABN8LIK2_9CNID|nr:unnamed protein product [Porites evermanni]